MKSAGAGTADGSHKQPDAPLRQRMPQTHQQGGRSQRPLLREEFTNLRMLVHLAFSLLMRVRALTSAVAVGLLLTVVTLCIAPVYTAASGRLTIQTALSSAAPLDRNVETYVSSVTPTPAAHLRIANEVMREAAQTVGAFTSHQPTAYAIAAPLLLTHVGDKTLANASQPGVQLQGWDFPTTSTHMRFLAGTPPAPTPQDQPAQVIITKQMADDLSLRLGSTLTIVQFGRLSSQAAQTAVPLAVVVGIWEPLSATDPYWNSASFLATPQGNLPIVYPVLMSGQRFYAAISAFAGLSVTQYWVFTTVSSQLTPLTLNSAPGAISRLRSLLETTTRALPTVTDVGVITQLDHLVMALHAQLDQLSLPVNALLALLAAFACAFIAVTSGILAEANARALVILGSRGASGAQLLGVVGVQAALLEVVALLLGPPLAAVGVWALFQVGLTTATPDTFSATPGAFAHSVALGSLAAWACAGAFVGAASIVLGARAIVGQSTTAYARHQGRQERAIWRLAPIELALLLLAVAGYVEFTQLGTLAAQTGQTGIGTASLLVVAAPALLLLCGALLAARLAPTVASWALIVGLRHRGITLVLAMAPLVRGTARFAQMALLTTLALGLACFALIFRASLNSAQASASAYRVGSDARIVQQGAETQGFDARLLETYSHLPGVRAAAPAYRTQETTPSAEGSLPVETLAIDPARFGAVVADVSWRQDYAAQPLTTLLARLAQPAPTVAGAAAPWVIVSASYATRFDTRVGDHLTLLLAETSAATMTFTVAAIAQAFPTLSPDAAAGGFVVVSLPTFAAAVAAQQGASIAAIGANEFWLRMTAPSAANHAIQALMASKPQLDIDQVILLSDVRNATAVSPIGVGLGALLLFSAGIALTLAALAALIQTLAAARRERVRFAILRTLGLPQRVLALLPIQELLLTQALGIVVGSAAGTALLFAVTPLLRVIQAADASAQSAGPPLLVVIPALDLVALYGLLLITTGTVVLLSIWRFRRSQLGNELRTSED